MCELRFAVGCTGEAPRFAALRSRRRRSTRRRASLRSSLTPQPTRTPRTLASFSMANKVCVVTGAGRGLGNLMARTLVESGASDIVIIDLKREDAAAAASELAASFVEQGLASEGEINALGIGCNVADEESVKAAFEEIRERFGRVDALVTAAGIVENFKAHDYPTEKIRKLLDINVMGTWFCGMSQGRRREGCVLTRVQRSRQPSSCPMAAASP